MGASSAVRSKQSGGTEQAEGFRALSFLQRRLWVLAQTEGGGEACHRILSYRLTGEPDRHALKRALDRIAGRHDTLRAAFQNVDGEPVQRTAGPDSGFCLREHDLSARPQATTELDRLTKEEAGHPFDLEHGPLVRGLLVRLAAREHVLQITMHPMVSDGWSIGVLSSELSALYQAYRAGEADPLPPLPMVYADYALWQRGRLTGEALELESAYWLRALAGVPPLLELPTDRLRPAQQIFTGGVVELQIEAELTRELKALGRRHGMTLHMLFAAAWAAVLSRLSGQDDVVMGTVFFDRSRSEIAGLIGFLVNTQALRVQVTGTITGLLERVKSRMLEAQQHQELSFGQVVELVEPFPSPAYTPIFQVLLAWQSFDHEIPQTDDLRPAPELAPYQVAEFDLELDLREVDGRIAGGLKYAAALFDRGTIERHIGYLRRVLAAMVIDQDQAIDRIDLLSDAERRTLIESGDGGPVLEAISGSRDGCLFDLVATRAERSPEAVALIEPGREVTYRELIGRANGLGWQLCESGVGPETKVAILTDRSVESIVGVLGILAAGGAYVPIDPSFPDERIAFLLEDASAQILLAPEALAERARNVARRTDLAGKVAVIAAVSANAARPDSTVTPANAAYVIYTSGSTGTPRGVVIEHRGAVNLVRGFIARHDFAGHRLLMIPPLIFDASVGDIFPALSAGATIVLHPAPAEMDSPELERFCREFSITAIDAPAALWRRWVEGLSASADSGTLLPGLTLMMFGGESVSVEQVRRFARLTENRVAVANHYGPTEASVCATMLITRDGSGLSGVDLPIGRPLPGVRVYVLDPYLQLAPRGVAGELCIAGAGVAREYLRLPELTSERFVRDPFSADAAGRMYRTGDLARWNADGTLQFIGRRDHQVKVRGLRIELGEIEARLAEHPNVREAAVTALEDASGDRRLVAYFVADRADRGREQNGLRKTLGTDQITELATVFDEMHDRNGPVEDMAFNIAGWNSSYTGRPIPPEEMRVWVETTAQRILSLHPRRVWEIGCGTGLLMFRIAPQCDYFLGTDVSQSVVESLQRQIQEPGLNLSHVMLKCRPAHEFDRLAEKEKFDAVVLNSVLHYFPDIDHLVAVIAGAVESLRPGGAFFIGDVRSLPLLEAFHASVQLSQAPASLGCGELRERVQKGLRFESELVVDPEFFTVLRQRLPQIGRVEINLKRGGAHNELSCFRYDVVLHVGDPGPQIECPWLDWSRQSLSPDSLREILGRTQPEALGVTGMPNARVLRDVAALRILASDHCPATVGELRDALAGSQESAVEPEDIWALEESLPYSVEIRWGRGAVSECDLLFRRKDPDGKPVGAAGFIGFPEEAGSVRPLETYATDPLGQRLAGRLVPELRRWLREKLPEYMVPAAYVRMDSFPLTPTGKLDRKALPAPDAGAYLTREYVAPVGQVESTLARIWSEVLNLERVGRHDNFFELGGHSLLAATVIRRMREAGFQVDVRALFESPTLIGLAEAVGGERREVVVPPNLIPPDSAAIAPAMLPLVGLTQHEIDKIVAGVPGGAPNVQDIYPLAPLQEGFLFHHLLEKEGDVYLITRLLAAPDREFLDRYVKAMPVIIDRHDILRTAVAWEGLPEPVQVVWRHAKFVAEEVALDPSAGDIAEQLRARFDPRHYRLDVRHAPLLRWFIAEDKPNHRWLILELMHHLIGDQAAGLVMQQELQAIMEGQSGHLPAPAPFREFVVQARAGVSREEQEAFFTRMLGDVDEPTAPFGMTDAQGDGSRIVETRLALERSLSERLRTQARKLEVTLAGICHVAWALVLGRTSGRDDVVFGTVMSGRAQAGEGSDSGLGIFINTLPIRIRVGDESAQAVVRDTHALLTQMLRHEHTPLVLARQCSAVQPPAPLFTSFLNYRHVAREDAVPAFDLAGVNGADPSVAAPVTVKLLGLWLRTNFPFGMAVLDSGHELVLESKVDRSVDPLRVCAMMHTALESLVTALERDPMVSVCGLEVLPSAERHQLSAEWNATELKYPRDKCLHELFEDQVERTPKATAVMFEDAGLSYTELNRQANRLAHYLRELGVGPDGRVAICLERGVEMIVALLGIWKAGGAYVPLDPVYPPDRLSYMLEHSAPAVLLTQRSLRERFERIAETLRVIDLPGPSGLFADRPDVNPNRATVGVSPEHLAYMIYTSGSTGLSRGVMVEHRSVVNLFFGLKNSVYGGCNAGCLRVSVNGSLSFDTSVKQIIQLLAGHTLDIVPEEVRRDGEALLQFVRDRKTEVLDCTPSQLQLLLQAGLIGENPAGMSLRLVLVGGESIEKNVWQKLADSPIRFFNVYGPTECTVDAGVCDVTPESQPSIGGPIANTALYVLDGHLNLVPAEVPGELYIRGHGVARGYWNDPETTAQKFIADPFSSFPNSRLYRTGDRVRRFSNGNLAFLERTDDQVKLRGYRIEPGEIAARLAAHEEVREAVVLAREDESGNRRLVAYYTTKDFRNEGEPGAAAERLRGYLAARLPDYMVPVAYVLLQSLPLTANGKLDRKALPAPGADAYVARGYEAAVGEVERAITRIWAEVLGLERVGRNDNFFELGGHSLLAVTVIERMRAAGLPAEVRVLFASPTPKGLAAAMESAGESPSVVVPPNLIPAAATAIGPDMLPLLRLSQGEIDRIVAGVPGGAANVQDIYPLAPLQEGILFHHLLNNDGDVYLLAILRAARSRQHLDRYVKALRAVIERHDILRTAFFWEGLPEPVQVVWRHASLKVEEISLDPAAGDIAEQLRARFDPGHCRLDVREAPLWRIFIAEDAINHRWVMLDLMHHLISDHVTLQIVRHETHAVLRGEAERLPTPLPFRNFVAQVRLGVSREEHEAFFTRMLGDVDEPTAPFGLINVQGDGSRIAEARREVDSALCRRMRTQARKQGMSVASICHLAWALVLARTSGREDVVFGTVLFGRMQGGEGADRALGIFINTLPLRIQVGDEDVRSALRGTHDLLTQLLRHEHASLVLAQRCSGVQAPLPLFTSFLNYRHGGDGESASMKSAGEAIEDQPGMELLGGRERTNYPLVLAMNDLEQELEIETQVEGLIDPRRVCAMMHAALESLVEALENAPATRVCQLNVLPPEERHHLLVEWNDTEAPNAGDRCLHELFEEQVTRTPKAIAVVFEDESLSYEQLNRRSNRLAHHLRKLGVKPDNRVGVCAERSTEMVVALLAVLKAAGAYVPLDPEYPEERLRYMVSNSRPAAVLTQAHLRQLAARGSLSAGWQVPVVNLTPDVSWQEEDNPERGETGLISGSLAYVIYTSGSTGTPKGVMIEHRSIVNRLIWMQREYALQADDAILQKTPFSFDVSVWEFFWPLLTGARLVIARPGGHKDPQYLSEAIEKNRITTLHFVPSMLQAFLEHGETGRCSTLRRVVCSGEALSSTVAGRCRERLPQAGLHNLYGPTESAVDVTAWTYPADAVSEATIPIGRPIANTQIYILDRNLQPVPVGVAGELYIGGVQVARGYLNREDLTAERFVKDPFAKTPEARMYRTGDLGRWLVDGNIEYLGRNDFQVKIRGFRIEPGEIESRLLEHPGVREAAVVAREDVPGEQRLVAYYVCSDQAVPDAEELRRHLLLKLPDYMVPAACVPLSEFPLSANGKLDRKKLPAPGSDAWKTRGYEPPLDESETTAARIWAEVLKLERVGRNDNFFELGGHSLLAIRVAERMREAGLAVNVSDLFAFPVLKDLAQASGGESPEIVAPPSLIPVGCEAITPAMLPLVVLGQSDIDRIVAGVPGGAANVQDIYPLAPLQEGILFHHLLEREGDVYLSATLLAASDREHLDCYLEALKVVVDRHDILRTAFFWEGLPEPVQVVWRHAPLVAEEVTLDSAAGDIAEQLRTRFDPRHYRLDVRQAPLWRMFIAQDVVNNRWVILELKHHLTGDNTTGRFLLSEVRAALRGEAQSLPAPLPFRNFVAQARLGVRREEHEAFFARMLGDVDQPTAPFGLTNVQGDGSRIVEGHHRLDAESTRRLRAQARALGVTVAGLCHLAWALVLARTSGRDDVVFGTVLFGRMQGGGGAGRALGIFINTLPLRLQPGDEDVRAGVRHTHKLLTQLFRHEHASLTLAQRCSGVQAPAPLFTSLFNYRHRSHEDATLGEIVGDLAGVDFLESRERNNYPFALAINDLGDDMSIETKVDRSVDPQLVCAMMHTALESLTRALESDSPRSVRSVEVLPAPVREQMICGWNRTQADYPESRCIHLQFEQQAERTPNLCAVASQGEALSYLELNRRASRLGHYLRGQGVRPDERVVICMSRGVEMVVALLGIMKAGGACVGLDAGYPEERLRWMIEDAGARIALTQQSLAEKLRGSRALLVCMDEDAQQARIAEESDRNPEPVAASENLVYVIYTSGSTGRPKGVGIEHRHLANYVQGIRRDLEALGMAAGAKYATVSTLSADLGNTVIYPSLVSGGELHVIGEDQVMDGGLLGEYFERERIDCLKIVPSHLAGVRGAKGGERVMPRKVLVVGGEASTWQWVKEWQAAGQCAVINHYGPTETTVGAARFRVASEAIEEEGIVPIGQPLGNVQLYVLDRHMDPVPAGVSGELYIGGAGVGRGYVNRPELTAERFVPDPFFGSGERLYRSGDLVRRRQDGNIEFLGRIDQQVKIRGFRIELGEIETALREYPGVDQAAVLAVDGENGSKFLAAYFVPSGGSEKQIDAEELRRHLLLKLPDYMVPSAYVLLSEFPLNANGKLDRKKLPAPDAATYPTHGYEPPVTGAETTTARIWTEVLKVGRVGRNDNFFELGGHSLLAIRIVERMREAGLAVSVRDLFASPVLRDLAGNASGAGHEIVVPPSLIPAGCAAITPDMLPLIGLSCGDIDRIVTSVPGGAANVQDIYPLAPLQEGILFHHLLEKEGDVYLSATLLAAADRERLNRYLETLKVIVDRHDILRTAFVWEGLPEPVQVVWRHAPLMIEEVRLDADAGDIAEQMRARFDPRHYRLEVREAPLWRIFIAEDVANCRWVILELKHHLTGDNTTGRFLLSEVREILRGEAGSLPAPLPFRNFVAQARLGVSREEHEAFFSRMLGDVDQPTAPFGLTNVQGDGSRIVEGRRRVDAESTLRLRTQARALGVTVAGLCHMAWALVLARTSGRNDVVFGTVLFGRMQGGEGADRALGIFINTLPLRLQPGDADVRAGVRHTHELLTQLFRHEHASLTLAQRCSGVPAPAPLFTSLFNYRHESQEAVNPANDAAALEGIRYLESTGRTNYPFVLAISDLEREMEIEAQVEASIDPRRVCAMMHTALESLLAALENAPATPLRHLEVLPPAERRQLLVEWNGPEMAYPGERCLHELFEDQAKRTPKAIAVVFEDESLNYEELNRLSNRLAHHLRKMGVKPNNRVGICAERSPEMVVALLAILKAGGAYVPLDPEYPEERLLYMVHNSGPAAVLTQSHLQHRVSAVNQTIGAGIPILDLSAEDSPWQREAETNPEHGETGLNSGSLAYVIYTSGSTGTPKGVMIEHRSIVNRLIWMQSEYELQADDAILQKTPFSFDVSVWEFFWPLLTGARLVIARPGGHKDPQYLSEAIEKNRITTLHFVPSMLQAFLEHGETGRCSTLRRVVCSGEALSAAVAGRCRERLPQAGLHNLYGPTEAAVDVTAWTYPADAVSEAIIPIGRPIANTQIYILDRNLQPVPVGVAGELYIGGVQVARGYLNREDLTAERFVKDPFAKTPEARMYRTGDLGRWLADGNIEYLGRNDFQVKIRGFRIEPGEIESRLLEHPGVREAAVVAREDVPGEQRLVAYYVCSDQAVPDAEELRRHLLLKLPDYMVPAACVPLSEFPLSANGKLDRKALPAPDSDAYITREYEAPQGETETALAAIWAEVLKLKRVGRNDNFFELGGHSLLAMQLINRIRMTLGADVQLRDIFAAATVREMAAVLSALAGLNELLSDPAASSAEGRYL